MILWLWSCAEPTGGAADTNTDTGALSESTPPEPTGDTGEAPCPFEGSWGLVGIDVGGLVPFAIESGAYMGGTALRCEWDLLVVRTDREPNCRQHELAVLLAEPFGAWTAWSDGAPDMAPEGCGPSPGPYESRAYPVLSEDGQSLTLSYGSAIFYGQSPTYYFERN